MFYEKPAVKLVPFSSLFAYAQSGAEITGIDPGDPGTCLGVTVANLGAGEYSVEMTAQWLLNQCGLQYDEVCSGYYSISGVMSVDPNGNAQVLCQQVDGCNDCYSKTIEVFRQNGECSYDDGQTSSYFCIVSGSVNGHSISSLPICVEANSLGQTGPVITAIQALAAKVYDEIGYTGSCDSHSCDCSAQS